MQKTHFWEMAQPEAVSGGSGTGADFGMNSGDSWTRAVAVRAGSSGMASVAMTVRALGVPDLRPLDSEPPGQESNRSLSSSLLPRARWCVGAKQGLGTDYFKLWSHFITLKVLYSILKHGSVCNPIKKVLFSTKKGSAIVTSRRTLFG